MKSLPLLLIPALLTVQFLSASEPEVRFGGRVGEVFGEMIQARANSSWARGALYDEAERAFATCYDSKSGWNVWQGEYWGKTMLSLAVAARYTGDEELKAWMAAKARAFLKAYQRPDGYIGTYHEADQIARGFNVWSRKYTLWALIEIHRLTGEREFLDAAVRLADHLIAQVERLGVGLEQAGEWHGVSAMSILKPMVELAELTGQGRYRAFCRGIVKAFSEGPANPCRILKDARRKEPIMSWYPTPTYWAKAYEIMSCLEGVVAYCRLTGEQAPLADVVAYYNHLVAEELNHLGSVGYFDHFIDARHRVNAMTELCDVIHWMRLNRELYALTGESRYADAIELAFCNAYLAGVERGGRWGAHIVRSHGTRHLSAPPQAGMFEHQCCPDNMMRALEDLTETAVTRRPDGSLAIAQFFDTDATLSNASVRIRGAYPWHGEMLTIRLDLKQPATVRLRNPAWSRHTRLDGKIAQSTNGWLTLDAPAGTTRLTLQFDLSPILHNVEAYEEPVLPSPQPNGTNVMQYTTHFMEWYTPEMANLSRTFRAMSIRRGPLVLAKSRLNGNSRSQTLHDTSLAHLDYRARLHPAPKRAANSAVPQTWRLTLTRSDREYQVEVTDFASASNINDPENWFSIWF
ncbi:MAG: glycoside hydrolase family 127 protein [Kiritimatiellia bacterium]|nr:glycoside hydrolase family 127 protein [Kiritimatiellia bacterium]